MRGIKAKPLTIPEAPPLSERLEDVLYRAKDLAYSLPATETREMLIAMLKEAIKKTQGRWIKAERGD